MFIFLCVRVYVCVCMYVCACGCVNVFVDMGLSVCNLFP